MRDIVGVVSGTDNSTPYTMFKLIIISIYEIDQNKKNNKNKNIIVTAEKHF